MCEEAAVVPGRTSWRACSGTGAGLGPGTPAALRRTAAPTWGSCWRLDQRQLAAGAAWKGGRVPLLKLVAESVADGWVHVQEPAASSAAEPKPAAAAGRALHPTALLQGQRRVRGQSLTLPPDAPAAAAVPAWATSAMSWTQCCRFPPPQVQGVGTGRRGAGRCCWTTASATGWAASHAWDQAAHAL